MDSSSRCSGRPWKAIARTAWRSPFRQYKPGLSIRYDGGIALDFPLQCAFQPDMEVRMATVNPYRSPTAAVDDQPEEYGEVRIFSSSGRIGRVRYIGYGIGLTFLIGVAGGILGGALGAAGMKGGWLQGLIGLAVVCIQILLTIQRSHDFNATGWLSLLALVPLINLMFWFVPGTDGPNRYGPPPPPNTAGTVALALILPVLFVIILGAVAVPAYKAYTERARAMQQR
jgi:uncharacterized membrane protein YhaH (DUF805 family)